MTISFLDVGERFKCPSCQVDLRSRGRGNVIAFEIAAFFVFGFPLGFLIFYERYIFAVMLGLVWFALEVVVRNAALRLERDDGTKS